LEQVIHGTLALADMIGLDICLAIMETLYKEFAIQISSLSAAGKNGAGRQTGT
jgi:3-hydroxyacyl-CoA dehydrogenase